ncbi:START-like domain containing protein [Cryptosporidium felis]|nr:START-like domain containing protein [Cryptosporidium felis]
MRIFKWKKGPKKIIFRNKRRNTINYVIENLNNSNLEDGFTIGIDSMTDLIALEERNEELQEQGLINNGPEKGILSLKEYIVNLTEERKKNKLSSNHSEELKFYSMDFNGEENKDFQNLENNSKEYLEVSNTIMKNSKLKNIKLDFTYNLKKENFLVQTSATPKRITTLVNTPTFSNQNMKINPCSNSVEVSSLNYQSKDKQEERSVSGERQNLQEMDILFSKVRKWMRTRYFEFKGLLEEVSLWEDYGFKSGIKFYRKKEPNNDIFTVIRGVIDTDLDKENDSFYEGIRKKKISIKKKFHLSELISSKEFIHYIWSTDPLSYDNTIDKSYRVKTWDDGSPGYCVYYHSYKGALGVQGREFLLVGYKDTPENVNQPISLELSKFTSLSNSGLNSPNSAIDYFKTNTNNNSFSPNRLKRWSKKNKKNEKLTLLTSNKDSKNDSAFFISSDLYQELSDDKLFNSMIQNNSNPSFVKANCYLNGVNIEKINTSEEKIILRMDILWIGDLNGKLPEFLKKTLLASSLSTIKVLKEKFIEMKKKELMNIICSENKSS